MTAPLQSSSTILYSIESFKVQVNFTDTLIVSRRSRESYVYMYISFLVFMPETPRGVMSKPPKKQRPREAQLPGLGSQTCC